MREFCVVILSNDPKRLTGCLEALMKSEPELTVDRIIVMAGPAVLAEKTFFESFCQVLPQKLERFNFSREVNRGLEVAWSDRDAFLLGDDALLAMPGVISKLAERAEALRGLCILSPAVVGRVSLGKTQGDLSWASQYVYDRFGAERKVQMVPFFCTYIPSETRTVVGKLDERFTDYGSDDDDYCYRARLYGIPVLVLPTLSVYHQTEDRAQHTARWGADRFNPDGTVNHKKFIEKHGSYPPPEVPYDQKPSPFLHPGRVYLKRDYEVFTVSGNRQNYLRLLKSIARSQPKLLSSGRLHCYASWKPEPEDGAGTLFQYIPQTPDAPFVITRENNRAFRDIWGRGHDAVMVEDDVDVVSPNLFDQMALYAEAYQGRCILQPGIEGFRYGNICLTPNPNFKVRIEPKHYPLICVYFPVEVELLVGFYDEGFVTYGGDDNDYSLRCLAAGVLQVALPSLVAKHLYSESVYAQKGTRNLTPSTAYFHRKWGHGP